MKSYRNSSKLPLQISQVLQWQLSIKLLSRSCCTKQLHWRLSFPILTTVLMQNDLNKCIKLQRGKQLRQTLPARQYRMSKCLAPLPKQRSSYMTKTKSIPQCKVARIILRHRDDESSQVQTSRLSYSLIQKLKGHSKVWFVHRVKKTTSRPKAPSIPHSLLQAPPFCNTIQLLQNLRPSLRKITVCDYWTVLQTSSKHKS